MHTCSQTDAWNHRDMECTTWRGTRVLVYWYPGLRGECEMCYQKWEMRNEMRKIMVWEINFGGFIYRKRG